MAINVRLGEAKTHNEKPFPKLMKSIYETVVLFTAPKIGTVICEGDKSISSNTSILGEYYEKWNMFSFTDYNEPITIQNA